MNNFSIIIPIYNESENIISLHNEIVDSIPSKLVYEILYVDDCSKDDTTLVLKNLSNKNNVNFFQHKFNLGQSKALDTGIKKATYDTIVTMDGDGQNDPKDIITLINIFFSNDYSLVAGIRNKRKDNLIKIISSKFANFIRSFILKDKCPDTGCSLKVFTKNVYLKFPFFNGMHRFFPALFIGYGYKTHYVNVNHRPRLKGKSKYGTLDRLFKGIFDLVKVKIILINKGL